MLALRTTTTRRSVTFYGAPGSHEGFTVKVSTARKENGARKLSAAIKGEHWSYCGTGNMHRIPVDIRSSSWDSERDSLALQLMEARDGNVDAAETYLDTMLSFLLDDLQQDDALCDCPGRFDT